MTDPAAPPAPETTSRPSIDAPAAPGGADGHPAPQPQPGADGQADHEPASGGSRGDSHGGSRVGKFFAALRRRWKAVLGVMAAVLLVGVVVGYFVVNHVIRSQLASLVQKNLHGELVGGSVRYKPLLGFVLRDAKVVRDDGHGGKMELLHLDRLDCRFDKLPVGKGPVRIESLTVQGLAVHLVSTEQKEKNTPEACCEAEAAPGSNSNPKLSDKVQIRHLRLEGGSLTWHDLGRPDVPDLGLSNVSANVGPPPPAGGAQPFDVSVKDGPADLQAKGKFQGDELLVALDKLALDVRLDPSANQTPLPASLAQWAQRYAMKGSLSLHGKGEVPLDCPQLTTFDGALVVDDVSARPPGAEAPIEKVRLKVLADVRPPPAATAEPTGAATTAPASPAKPATRPATAPASPATAPGSPTSPASPAVPGLHLQLAYCEASYAGSDLKIDSGEFWEDRGWGTCRIARLAGHVTGAVGGDKPEGPSTTQPPPPKIPATAPTTNPDEPPDAPPGAPVLRGRFDFTAAAGWPLSVPTTRPSSQSSTQPAGPGEPPHYEIILLPRDVALQPKSFPLPIEHIGGGMIQVTRDSATASGLAGTYGGDRLTLNRARLPLPEEWRNLKRFPTKQDLEALSRIWKVEARIEEMSGTLTCYQPGPVYPKGVQSVFRTIHPQGTVALGGRILLNNGLPQPGKPKPKDDFALDVTSEGGVSFALTDLGIPITHVRGKAQIDPVHIVIGTDGQRPSVVEGHSMGGTVTVHLDIAPRTDRQAAVFTGEGWLRDVNMTLMCKLLDVQDEQLSKAGGKGYLHAHFAIQGDGAPRPPIDTLRAQGELEVIGANFWEDPVVGPIAAAMRGGKPGEGGKAKTEQGLGDAAAVFRVADRTVTLDRAAINSPTIGIQGSGTVTFDKQLNLELTATPIGNLKAAIKQAAPNPAGEVAGDIVGVVQGIYRAAAGTLLYQYRVKGPADHPTHEVVPAPVLTDPVAFLFGRMADPKGGDLLKAVQSSGPVEKKK